MKMEDTPTCYICMEPSSGTAPFLTRFMCTCSSKADSSLKVHQLCLELCRDRTGSCAVCKAPLDGDWAFDARYDIKWKDGEQNQVVITQMKRKTKHGAYYVLGDTDAYHGPIRYLAVRGTHKDGKLDGPLTAFRRSGAIASEINYEDGIMHGIAVQRDESGAVTSEANYAHGQCHGLQKLMWQGVALSGSYENGIKVGHHIERAEAYMHVRRVTYMNGVRDGACIEYSVEAGDQLPTVTEFYRAGQLHGLQEIYDVDCETLTRTLKVEAKWIDGKKNGRRAMFRDNQLVSENHYYMDIEHGVQRIYECGQLMEETTYNLGTKHGRHRIWTMVRGQRTLFMDASFDNGMRHGIHRYMKYGHCYQESYWSDGTKELRHGSWTLSQSADAVTPMRESNWHMNVRHGLFCKREYGQLVHSLNFKNGLLDGECRVWSRGTLAAIGNYKDGVAIGRQQKYKIGILTEDINLDEAELFHGTCSYYNSDGSRFQELNFMHGVLHGRQSFYSDGRIGRVISMRDGHVEGRFTLYNWRGEFEERIVKRGDLSFDEAIAGGVLCAPSERLSSGDFEFRYLCADGTVVACKLEAGGFSCDCTKCTRPRNCGCNYCWEYNPPAWEQDDGSYDDEEERYDDEDDRYDSHRDRQMDRRGRYN